MRNNDAKGYVERKYNFNMWAVALFVAIGIIDSVECVVNSLLDGVYDDIVPYVTIAALTVVIYHLRRTELGKTIEKLLNDVREHREIDVPKEDKEIGVPKDDGNVGFVIDNREQENTVIQQSSKESQNIVENQDSNLSNENIDKTSHSKIGNK